MDRTFTTSKKQNNSINNYDSQKCFELYLVASSVFELTILDRAVSHSKNNSFQNYTNYDLYVISLKTRIIPCLNYNN